MGSGGWIFPSASVRFRAERASPLINYYGCFARRSVIACVHAFHRYVSISKRIKRDREHDDLPVRRPWGDAGCVKPASRMDAFHAPANRRKGGPERKARSPKRTEKQRLRGKFTGQKTGSSDEGFGNLNVSSSLALGEFPLVGSVGHLAVVEPRQPSTRVVPEQVNLRSRVRHHRAACACLDPSLRRESRKPTSVR